MDVRTSQNLELLSCIVSLCTVGNNGVTTASMEFSTAVALIRKGLTGAPGKVWVDLGAGDGLFTSALSTMLSAGSKITAVDRNTSALASISLSNRDIQLDTIAADFEALEFQGLNGILMANSLHFIKDQLTFLKRIRNFIEADGRLVIVEYDTDTSNRWVPYAVSFDTLSEKIAAAGFESCIKMHEVPSRFGKTNIYSARIQSVGTKSAGNK